GVACLYRSRSAPEHHYAARAPERHMIEPARRQAEVLRQTDGGVGREREAGDRETVDVVLLQPGLLEHVSQAASEPPMCRADRIADVGHRHRNGDGDSFVAAAAHLRRLRSRRSKLSAGLRAKSASLAFCTLFVDVTGSSRRKATCPGALK